MKMTASNNSSSSRLGPSPTHVHHKSRTRPRRCLPCLLCLIISLLVLVLALTALILALTLFKIHNPTTTLLSANVTGISPRVTLPAIRIDLNITLGLDILIYNPNRASFAHAPGTTQLWYSGAQVGEADLASGRIPSRGSEHLAVQLTVEAGKLAAEVGSLIRDVLAGQVGFDTVTRMPGKVTFLGFIKHHAVATSACHVIVGFPDLKVKSQECSQKTKL